MDEVTGNGLGVGGVILKQNKNNRVTLVTLVTPKKTYVCVCARKAHTYQYERYERYAVTYIYNSMKNNNNKVTRYGNAMNGSVTTQPPALQHALASGDIPPVLPLHPVVAWLLGPVLRHLKAWARREIELRLWGVELATRQEHNP